MGDESLSGERGSEADLSSLTDRVANVEDDLDQKITDLRERVIQVKRESDANAPADHAHDELVAEVERSIAAVSTLRERVSDFDERTERGFENYERIVTTLRDDVDDVDQKLTRLAGIVVDLRSRIAALETRAVDSALDELRLMANRRGVRTAACENCGETLDVALLTESRCPLCNAAFDGVEPKRGFFGSARLTVDDRPALESDARSSGGVLDDDSGFPVDEPRARSNEVVDDTPSRSPESDD